MRRLNKNLISVFVFFILIALTFTTYYSLTYEKTLMDKTVLVCVAISETVTLSVTLFYNMVSGKKQLVMTAGGYTILFGYQIAVFMLSVLFNFYYRNAVVTYKIIFMFLSAAFLISSVLIYCLGRKVSDKANAVNDVCGFFKVLEYKTGNLSAINCEKTIHSEFEKIDNAVKSCDHSIWVDTDALIDESINTLLEQMNVNKTDNDIIFGICEKTFSLIEQRNAQVSGLKIGGV